MLTQCTLTFDHVKTIRYLISLFDLFKCTSVSGRFSSVQQVMSLGIVSLLCLLAVLSLIGFAIKKIILSFNRNYLRWRYLQRTLYTRTAYLS